MAPEIVKSRIMVCTYKTETPIALPMTEQEIQPLPVMAIDKERGQVYLVNAGNKTVYKIDASALKIKTTYPGNVLALSKNGQKLFVFMPNNKPGGSYIYMYDTVSGAMVRYNLYSQVPGPYPGIAMQVLPNLTRLYWSMVFDFSSFKRSNLQCYEVDAAANRMKLILPANPAFEQSVRAAAFNSDFTKVYTARWTELDIANVSDNQERKTIVLPGSGPVMFACKKTGNKLYLACENGSSIIVIDTANDHVTKTITLANKPVNIVISPDDKFLYAAVFDSSEIVVIDTATDTVTTSLTIGKSPYGMAFESGGDLLFVANYCSKTLSFIDAKSNQVLPFTLPTGADKGNPIDAGIYEDKDGTIKVFVAKEWYEKRVACSGDTKITGLDVSVFTIQKPKNI
jgi:YVTN family beta-propeller protein